MNSQESDVQILVKLFQSLEQSIKQDRKETNEHLERMRESLHKLGNEIHGVGTLSTMQQERIVSLEARCEKLETQLHARIDRNVAEIKKEMHEINTKIVKIAPSANTFSTIQETFIKWAVPIVCVAIMLALGSSYFAGAVN